MELWLVSGPAVPASGSEQLDEGATPFLDPVLVFVWRLNDSNLIIIGPVLTRRRLQHANAKRLQLSPTW